MKLISYVTNINENYIETKKNKICLLEVTPINFLLRSIREQRIILEAYKSFIKQCEFDIQFFIQTTKVNIDEHIEKIKTCLKFEPEICEMAEDYMQFLERFSNDRRSVARRFFIVIENNDESKIQKISQGLKACGNNVKVCTKEECKEILKECYKNFDSYTNHDVEDTQDEILKIYPFYFEDTNPNFLKINNRYIGTLIVNDYAKEMQEAFLNKILMQDINLTCSMFYERLPTSEVLKKITYSIGNAGSEIKTTNENQSDAEILGSTYSDAKYIRKKIQLEQEKLYNLYMYFSVCSDTKEGLEKDLQKLEAVLNGVGLVTRRGIFRQKETFEATMPLLKQVEELKKFNKRNVLSDGLCATYPFISNELYDENGVLVGASDMDKSLVMIDRFDTKKYKNSNMCVIGTSGSGKSYFTKLMILRNRYLNVAQYIIDPEREYLKVCKNLKGSLINFEDGKIINVLDIREFSDDGDGRLFAK
ncbi:MAG: ATP-binding protein [Clostridia bacterium]|nr:ATP-binding protein [Clostridia bacterium]